MSKQRKFPWDVLLEEEVEEADLPRITVMIPTINSARTILTTLHSLHAQCYPKLEIIVVDAGSIDRTLDLVQRSSEEPPRVYSVAEYHPYDMYNRAISLAAGGYISMLFPGDTYLSHRALHHIASLIVQNDSPELAYCGCLVREGSREPRYVLRDLSLENLRQGLTPSSLPSCWYRVDTLRRLGKLRSSLRARGGFELACRFFLHGQLRACASRRVLVDHEQHMIRPGALIRRVWETQLIVRRYFGRRAWFHWWIGQNPLRLFGLWWRTKRPSLT